jgi:nifR3 family TIM-barrel protein
VTLKFRIGIDDSLITYLDAGRVAEAEGCRAVGLHARTAAQLYDGTADWEAIATLKQALSIPVLGNGDIWEGHDALRMMRTTNCDGVIVGRGCLGRPWLFRDLADLFDGRQPQNPPLLGQICNVMLDHAERLAAWIGEPAAMRAFRKHATWYTKGFRRSAALRQRLMRVATLAELRAELGVLPEHEPFPPESMRVPRGKTAGTQKVSLPPGYLDQLDDDSVPVLASEDLVSGG